MAVKFRDNRGHRVRTYRAGKVYKMVDRPTDEDDEIQRSHAAELLEIGAVEKVKHRQTRPAHARHVRKAPAAKPKPSDDGPKTRD
jgi:hypothetical protein